MYGFPKLQNTKLRNTRLRDIALCCAMASLLIASTAYGHGENDTEHGVIAPDELERPEVFVPYIDTENAEIGIFGGGLNFDNFNTEGSYGALLAYHVNEDLFIELNYLESQVSDFELRSLGDPQLPNEVEPVYYTSLSAGMNMLPGEVFIGGSTVLSSTFYLLAGIGNMDFGDDDKIVLNVGFGYRVYLTDWASIRLEARNHMFENTLQGEEELRHNFELRLGASFFF